MRQGSEKDGGRLMQIVVHTCWRRKVEQKKNEEANGGEKLDEQVETCGVKIKESEVF